MLHVRALIVIAILVSCDSSDPPPAIATRSAPSPPPPSLCSSVCSSNIECSNPINLCKFCNFGFCSQTAPQVTVQLLSWIEDRIRERPSADPDAPAALQLLDELLARARRTAIEAEQP